MTREEVLEIQRKVMAEMEINLKEEKMPAILQLANDDFPIDVLNVLVYDLGENHTDCTGEITFAGINEVEDIQTLMAVITLSESLSFDHEDELYKAMNSLNFYLPYGAFCASKDNTLLVYKLSAPISTNLTEEELYTQLELFISNAYLVVDKYVDLLFDVAEGRQSADLIQEITGIN